MILALVIALEISPMCYIIHIHMVNIPETAESTQEQIHHGIFVGQTNGASSLTDMIN